MKINIEKKIVSFSPENQQETRELERLWKLLIDCNSQSKKISPIGEYIPVKKNTASFYIEGDVQEYLNTNAEADGIYYCSICNKSVSLKVGEQIPLCCSRLMELID